MGKPLTQTLSEENYLKAIYHLDKQGNGKVSATAIAEELDNNPASVVDMLKRLSDKKLIHYDKNKGAVLTQQWSENCCFNCAQAPALGSISA